MLEWIVIIAAVTMAMAYLAWRGWRVIRAKRVHGSARKASLTVGGRAVR
jgi:threonine/homoserine/homoserine lactone efflux protein